MYIIWFKTTRFYLGLNVASLAYNNIIAMLYKLTNAHINQREICLLLSSGKKEQLLLKSQVTQALW